MSETLLDLLVTIIGGAVGALFSALFNHFFLKSGRLPIWVVLLVAVLVALLTLILLTPSLGNTLCPRIAVISANPQVIPIGGESTITVITHNPTGSALTYVWEANEGSVPGGYTALQTIKYRAPNNSGSDTITVIAGNSVCSNKASIDVQIVVPSP